MDPSRKRKLRLAVALGVAVCLAAAVLAVLGMLRLMRPAYT